MSARTSCRVPAANVFLTANGRDPAPFRAQIPSPIPTVVFVAASHLANVRIALSNWLPILDPEESNCDPGSWSGSIHNEPARRCRTLRLMGPRSERGPPYSVNPISWSFQASRPARACRCPH